MIKKIIFSVRFMKDSDKKLKVLIVDDEVNFLSACKRFLEKDYAIYACSSGRLAMELINSGIEFNVIFLDVSIPDMSGIDIYKSMKNGKAGFIDRLIFITAGALDKETQDFLDNVKNTKLEKPFDLIRLTEQIVEKTKSLL